MGCGCAYVHDHVHRSGGVDIASPATRGRAVRRASASARSAPDRGDRAWSRRARQARGGDGVMSVFVSAADAIASVAAMQTAVTRELDDGEARPGQFVKSVCGHAGEMIARPLDQLDPIPVGVDDRRVETKLRRPRAASWNLLVGDSCTLRPRSAVSCRRRVKHRVKTRGRPDGPNRPCRGRGWWSSLGPRRCHPRQSGGITRIIQRCPSGSATCAAKAPHSRCEGS